MPNNETKQNIYLFTELNYLNAFNELIFLLLRGINNFLSHNSHGFEFVSSVHNMRSALITVFSSAVRASQLMSALRFLLYPLALVHGESTLTLLVLKLVFFSLNQ